MIVEMKHLTLFLKQSSRQDALYALRELGVMHLKQFHKQAPDLSDIAAQIERADRAITVLWQYQKFTNRQHPINTSNQEAAIEHILKLDDALKSSKQALDLASQKLDWYKPWGGFNPDDIKSLSEKGIYITLYRTTEREYRQLGSTDGLHIISAAKNYICFVHIGKKTDKKPPLTGITLPEEGFNTLSSKYTMLKQKILSAKAELYAQANALHSTQAYKAVLEKKQQFLQAMHGMTGEQTFSYAQGYVPADRQDDIKRLAAKFNAGYLLQDADLTADDVPTLIRNPKWIKIISPVFKFMSTVPGYAEYDISLWFLLFFSLFFAMLIGDAGYGFIFLLSTFIMRKKFTSLPGEPFFLMYVLSTATIIWGAVTGTWFGAEAFARLPFLSPLVVQSISSFAEDNQNLMIFICFTIGIVHLTIAHLIVGFKMLNSLKALAELGWILVLWALYFLAGMLVINRPMPNFTLSILITGTILLLCFSQPQKNILKAIVQSLTNIPLKIIGSFADIVSYLRLFAVGCATVVLASTFNDIVISIGFHSVISGFAAAAVLFLGHALNIALGFMAVIVHGVRLNMLEFSGQMGMSWSGREYAPFKE